jgi:multiple sugar transport system permease protein
MSVSITTLHAIRHRHKRVVNLNHLAIYAVLILALILSLMPIAWLLVSSLKIPSEYMAYPIRFFPAQPQWINYLIVLTYQPFLTAAARSLGVGLSTATITMFTSALAGYAFSRLRVKSSDMLFTIVIAMLIVPGIVLQIPQFVLYARIGLINTYWPWYLSALGGSPLYIFMYRQFFKSFTKELEEAAEIDGCNPFRTFLSVILPNSKPVLATVMIYAFSYIWGDYITPTMFLRDPAKLVSTWVVPTSLPQLSSILLAATVVYILPVMILFIFVQKHIRKGMIFTGLSG